MDEMENDARFHPPNPYPQSNRRLFHSSNYSNLYRSNFFPSPIPRVNADSYDEEEEKRNDADEDNAGRGYLRTRNDADEDDEDCSDDSSENRGKRRRLDGYARDFDLVPRFTASSPLKPSPAEWSADSTFTLLDARGDRYLKNRRKSISFDERGDVAKKVYRSEAQCRNRLDSLKKYWKEKAKYPDCAHAGSKCAYFNKMDQLMLLPSPPPPPATQQYTQLPRLPCGIDAGEYVFASSRLSLNRYDGMDEMRDSPDDTGSEEGEEADDESDGLPPRAEKAGGVSESSFRMLANSIQRFGEVYQKMENSKRQQMAELDRMRREFHKDLDLQKRLILDWAQTEIARLRQDHGQEEEEVEERTNEDDSDDDDIDVSAESINGSYTFGRTTQEPW